MKGERWEMMGRPERKKGGGVAGRPTRQQARAAAPLREGDYPLGISLAP